MGIDDIETKVFYEKDKLYDKKLEKLARIRKRSAYLYRNKLSLDKNND